MLSFSPEAEFAWAVGLYEGEGTIGCYSNGTLDRHGNKTAHVKMQIVMADEDVLRRFGAAVGVGNLFGPYEYKNSNKPLWQWQLRRNAEVIDLAGRMIPYLSARRAKQALDAIEKFQTVQSLRAELSLAASAL